MRVLFISANLEKINMPALPLGLACAASATRRSGHEVALLDLLAEGDSSALEREIGAFRPEIIGISVRNIDDQNSARPRFLLDDIKRVVDRCREVSDTPIVLGGAGYSIFPESALSFLGAHMGIQGEGESVFPQLLERMQRGVDASELPGVYLPGRGLQGARTFGDLDSFPLPFPDLWPLPSEKEGLWMPVQTRRGCPLGCSYCSTGTIEGRCIRRRSPRAVAGWMEEWRAAGVRQFYFVDNTFNLPPAYAKDICRELIGRGLDIKWWAILYPLQVDEELVDLMAKAGCEQVSLGFESGAENILKNMKKRFTLKDVRKSSELLRAFGVRQMGFLLLGMPGETRRTVEESLIFADRLEVDSLKLTAGVRIYPHTDLARKAVEEERISRSDDLLRPRFYFADDLRDWLPEKIKEWASSRSHWITD